jgi:hypothetical protein
MALRPLPHQPAPSARRNRRQIDLCALTSYLRRDIGLGGFDCGPRDDWRAFR